MLFNIKNTSYKRVSIFTKMGFIAAILGLSLGFSIVNTEPAWVLIKEKEGVKIYQRDIPNSNLKQMRMISTIKGNSLSSFAALFQDLENYDEWVYSCLESKLLKKLAENEIIYYINSDFPWPLDDRDFVLKNTLSQDPNTLALHSKSVAFNNFYGVKSGIIRVKVFDAEWVITPMGNGKFGLVYTFSTDPAGDIPTWMINSFMDVGPLQTLKGMERYAQSAKYTNAKFSFISEAKK